MCASYGARESTFVSTRSTVPETLASAAARTLDATSPVNSFSVLPLNVWPPCDGSCGGRAWFVAAGVAVDDADVADEAALAIAPPPSAAAPMAAAVTSVDRMLRMWSSLWGDRWTLRASPPPLGAPEDFAENRVRRRRRRLSSPPPW